METLKHKRVRELREEVRRYGHTAEAMEAIGMHWAAKYYRQVALDRSRQLEVVRDHRTSWQIRKDEKRRERHFDRLYPEAVELFAN